MPRSSKRGSVKALPESVLKGPVKHAEHVKVTARSSAELSFRVTKRLFGYQKVRFKDLLKNTALVLTHFALSNLRMARRTLLASAGEVRL